MLLSELNQAEAPIDLTPEQLRQAKALAQAISAAKLPLEPKLTEDQEDEFVEM
jgi:broad specificity phosphatase PhoE